MYSASLFHQKKKKRYLRAFCSCTCKPVAFCFKLYIDSSLCLNQLIVGDYLEEEFNFMCSSFSRIPNR